MAEVLYAPAGSLQAGPTSGGPPCSGPGSLGDDRVALGADELVSDVAAVHVVEDAALRALRDVLVLTLQHFLELPVGQVFLAEQDLPDPRGGPAAHFLIAEA